MDDSVANLENPIIADGLNGPPPMEMTQLEIAIDSIQAESYNEIVSSEVVNNDNDVSDSLKTVPVTNRSVSFGPISYSEPTISENRSISFNSYPSVQSILDGDEIALVEDVDIDVAIPSRLLSLEFPKADDGREEDVARVIRKSFSKLGVHPSSQYDLSTLSDIGLHLHHVSLMSQIEAAIEGQEPGDLFWEEVCYACLQKHCQEVIFAGACMYPLSALNFMIEIL